MTDIKGWLTNNDTTNEHTGCYPQKVEKPLKREEK